ncbi:MAG: hypothetical protein KDC54_13855 [Lewinella sp.]|nr:hypothetical protein [Lewinella sp.]
MDLLRLFRRDRWSNPWRPLPHTVLKDEQLKAVVHEEGIAVRPFLDQD